MTPYNAFVKLLRGNKAGRQSRVAPAASGVINVSPVFLATLQFDVTGARTLESASNFDIGASILVCATVSGVTVNSVAIADGSSALFQVVLDASGAKVWRAQYVTPATPVAFGTVAVASGDDPTDDLIVAIANLLINAGFATGAVTDAA